MRSAQDIVGEFLSQGAPNYLALLSITDLPTLAVEIERESQKLVGATYNQKALTRNAASIALNSESASKSDLISMLSAMLAMDKEIDLNRAAIEAQPKRRGRRSRYDAD